MQACGVFIVRADSRLSASYNPSVLSALTTVFVPPLLIQMLPMCTVQRGVRA
jgi:hypothetical protein